MDGELFTCAFVECALPPVGEVVDGLEQAFGAQLPGGDGEDRYLLSFAAFECGVAVAGYAG